MLDLILPPLAACMVIVAIHSYLGLHIIAREVIFVDLSLAQMAALGSTVAIFAGSDPGSTMSYVYALGFTTIGAGLFALTRTHEKGRVPQEAIIGIVYVVASAAAILVADRVPRGGEAIKDILVGSLLWVTWPAILKMAAVYAALGVFHFVLRKRFLTISFEPETALANGWSIRWWDFWFYLSFGVVITLSVPIAGVLLVFYTFSLLTNLIAAPFNGLLAEAVERKLTGRSTEAGGGLARLAKDAVASIASELRKLLYFALRAVPLLILSLIPVVNVAAPLLWFLLMAWMLTVEYADYPMGNHGITFPGQRKLLASRRYLSLGFGGLMTVVLMIPGLNFLVIPAGVAGATAMWVEQLSLSAPEA